MSPRNLHPQTLFLRLIHLSLQGVHQQHHLVAVGVVNVLEEEQAKLDTEDPDRTSLANLKDELSDIKTTLRAIEDRLDASANDSGQREKPPPNESH